jgi:hypothetical protein
MRTHHADRRGVAELEGDGASPPSGVDTVDMSLSQRDDAVARKRPEKGYADSRNRTVDPIITNDVLYQLS